MLGSISITPFYENDLAYLVDYLSLRFFLNLRVVPSSSNVLGLVIRTFDLYTCMFYGDAKLLKSITNTLDNLTKILRTSPPIYDQQKMIDIHL